MEGSEMISTFFTLIGIIAFLGIVFLFLKRYTKKVKNQSGVNIKIHERTPVFPKGHLVIAEVAGKYYLLGATENNINILKELEIEEKENLDIEKAKFTSSKPIETEDLSFKSFIRSTFSGKQSN